MIDACLEYGESIGLLAVSDQSDGYWFLAHSFPIHETVADICSAMSRAMRSATGIATATIREKPIKLPKLPTLKTAMFEGHALVTGSQQRRSVTASGGSPPVLLSLRAAYLL